MCIEIQHKGACRETKYSTRRSQVLYLSGDTPQVSYSCTHKLRRCSNCYIVRISVSPGLAAAEQQNVERNDSNCELLFNPPILATNLSMYSCKFLAVGASVSTVVSMDEQIDNTSGRLTE